MNLYEF